MGQYWYPVNLTKREFIDPHKLGTGLKLWEQLANHPGTGAALIILCAAMPEPRGGGDLNLNHPGVARQVIGRWAGDRIALVGDYAERGDLAPEDQAHWIYDLCTTEEDRQEQVGYLREQGKGIEADELELARLYTDISDMVCQVIEHELQGKFTGDGWREFKQLTKR